MATRDIRVGSAPGDGQGAHQGGLGDVGERLHDALLVDEAEDVAGRDAEQFAAAQGAQGAHGRLGILVS
jgi:hypothetical protein